MAAVSHQIESKGDFKDQQFEQNEVADKVVEQCKNHFNLRLPYVRTSIRNLAVGFIHFKRILSVVDVQLMPILSP